MEPYRPLAPLALFVACALVMGACGCSPSQSSSTTSTGGATSTSSTSVCVEGRMYSNPLQGCSSDADCAIDSYCNSQACGGMLETCINGRLVISDVGRAVQCKPACDGYPANCMTAGSAIKNQLTDNYCTVMVRVNADTDAIVGYAVNCGKPTAPTASDVLGRLLQMNSINWSGATYITDSRTTGLIVFTVANGPVQYTAYFSASTGNQLLLTQTLDADAGTGSFLSDITWHDGADLGISCTSGCYFQLVSFGPNISQSVLQAASVSIVNSNLIPALRVNLGPIDSISVTPIDVGQSEFQFFVNAHCANC